MQVYPHMYIHIYVQVAHNFDTFYATKLKLGMIFTQTKTLDHGKLPLGRVRGQNVYRSYWTRTKWQKNQKSGTITCPRK